MEEDFKNVPKRPYNYYWHAYTFYYQANRFREALIGFTKAIELGYNDPKVYVCRGRCHQILSEDKEALADLSHAIEMGGNDLGTAYMTRALLFACSQNEDVVDYKRALEDVEQALERMADDNNKIALLDAAKVYSSASRTNPALLDRAEELLFSAIDLGLPAEQARAYYARSTKEVVASLLNRPKVRRLLED